MIRVQPAATLLRPFAAWATAQNPKVRTVSPSAFAVPDHLFAELPEELLLGALVGGQPYTPLPAGTARLLDCGLCHEEDGEEVHQYPECTATEQGAAGPAEPAPGDAPPEVPEEADGPDTAPLAVEFVPLEDAPAEEGTAAAFTCAACGRDFTSERGLNGHRTRVHGG